MLKKLLAICATLLLSTGAQAVDCENWWAGLDNACTQIGQIWNEGEAGLMLSGYARHMSSTRSSEKIEDFNERAYGGGLSLFRGLENNNEDMLYWMTFADSHSKPATHIGYAYLWYWNIIGPLKAGAGVTAGLFSHSDVASYAPLPFALPLVAVKYDKVNFYATYIPGGRDHGNMLFIFSRFDY